MFCNDTIAGNWNALSERLDRAARWSVGLDRGRTGRARQRRRPGRCDRSGADADRSDAIVGAWFAWRLRTVPVMVTRLLVLLHLLSDMVTAMAAQFADLSPDVMQVIVSELRVRDPLLPVAASVAGMGGQPADGDAPRVLADYRPWVRRHPECVEQCVDLVRWIGPH